MPTKTNATKPTKKSPNPTDVHVGSRVRQRRMMLHMSQEKLGDALGLTFQQVQKYEKGTNRMGAGRLQQVAIALDVDVAWFYKGTATLNIAAGGDAPAVALVDEFLASTDGMAVVLAWPRLNTVTRRQIVNLVRAVAEERNAADMKLAC